MGLFSGTPFGSDATRDHSNDAGKSQSQVAGEDEAWRKQQQDQRLGTSSEGFKAQRLSDAKTYFSPGSADVGGHPGGAQEESDFFKSGMANNDAAQKNNQNALNTSLANMNSNRGTVSPENAALLARQDAARRTQGNALDMSRDAAMGRAPSAADAQTGMDMNNIMAGQTGALGSAKGLSALGGAQSIGASGVGMAGTQAALAGGMGRSKEIGDAMSQYGGAANNMFQGDMNRLSQGDKNSLGNAGLNDAWTEGNAGLAANQGKLSLSQSQADDAWYNQSEDPFKRQMQNDSRMNAIQNGANADSADAGFARRQANEDRNRAMIGGAVAGGLTLGGTAIGGPAGGALGSIAGGMGNSYITDRKNF